MELESSADDPEAGNFANEIAGLIQESGWQLGSFARAQYPNNAAPRGIHIVVFTKEQRSAAEIVKHAFEAVGIPVEMSFSENDSPLPMVITVGKKP